jgi:ATP-dependent DNA helicase RecQ
LDPLKALNKYFGYSEFRVSQLEIIEQILDKKNVLAVLPTGAGKSICYQIPALLSDNYSIVISPLIALMKDQVDSLNKTNEIAAFINSSQSFIETERVLNDIAYGKIKLVYVAPERLENTEFAQRLKNLTPEYLFIDEAHCISEWGHNFRPSYTKIKDFIEFTGIKKISAFTATATPEVVKDIVKQLGLKNVKPIIKGFERDNLFINVEITKKKKERCLQLIHQHEYPTIIYTSSRKKTEELTEFLQMNKINCQFYHAGLAPIIRKKIQEDFIENRVPVIIATNAFGMGIDKKNIRLVIHYNIPGTIENYYQEIGRAGRDGKNSFTYLLFDEKDTQIHNYFISNAYPTKDFIKNIYDAICDSAQVALGMKPGKDILINKEYIRLYVKQDFTNALLQSSLKYLEDAGYIIINSAYKSNDKIKIIFDRNRLKNFIKKTNNELIKELLIYILKNTGNEIFEKFTNINFNYITKETGFTDEELSETLNNLEYLGIIEYTKSDGKETITLSKPRVSSDELKLNYKKINEFYIASKIKLDKMVDYIYSNNCRFRYILNYFGEQADEYTCGKCDNCLKENHTSDYSINFVKEKIIELLDEFESPIPEKEIIDTLLGKNIPVQKIPNKFHGVLKGYNKTDLIKAFRKLEADNSIQSQKIKAKTIYRLVKKDENFATTDATLFFSEENNYDQNIELYHQLREVREKAAKKFLQSPNIICPDSLLSLISREQPKTKGELLGINGFNERMFNKVGNDFLEIINSFKSNENSKAKEDKILPTNIRETYKLLNKKYNLREISELRKLTEAVVSMQIESIIEYFPDIDVSSIIDENKLRLVKVELESGFESLKGLKEQLPKDFTYPLIRIALAKLKVRAS